MSNLKPVVSLEDLNNEERQQLSALTMKGIKNGLIYYAIPFLLCSGAAVYINQKWLSWEMDNDNLRATLNVILVIGAMLPARLFVGKVIQHTKASNAWKKKVYRGQVSGTDGNTIFISNQKVKLPKSMAAQFKIDDEVEIGVSMINDLVIYAIKK